MVPLCACAAVLGIDDGHPIPAGDDGGGPDATVVDGASVGDAQGGEDAGGDGAEGLGDADAGDAGDASDASLDSALPPVPDGATCDPAVTLGSTGLFVAPTGSDTAPCSQAAPCATIQHAIGVARNTTPPVPPIYVQGDHTYTEQLTLQAGVQIIGGWSADWATHDCTPPTIVQAPPPMTTTVLASYAGTSTLSSLTVESKANANPGETIVGISATGASTVLDLSYVVVNVAGGGDGLAGSAGDAGVAVTAACATAGDGGASEVPGGKGTGADAGWFTDTGFASMTGGPGGTGGNGMNGPAGAAGSCIRCYATCTGTILCSGTDGGVECGNPGEPGCGGPGGFGGVGGGTGGSSVALFVSGATVKLTGGILQSGNGGAGGPGGPGGGGAAGSVGAEGTVSASCGTTCASVSSTCSVGNPETAAGGAPGGKGGAGAGGGAGGDGAGGDSYAIVEVGGASVQQGGVGTTTNAGLPGAIPDGGNGAPGSAGPTLDLP